jgi:dTDP-4-dehydrorhamnose reductase
VESSRILVTGASGQVGGELLHTLAPFGEVVAPTRAEMDLADTASIQTFVRALRPRWIVNAAAYTAVDKAESEQALAYAINAEAVRTLAIEAEALGAPVLHFSTDYVFSGQSTQPYIETDITGPLGVYGATKLAGEQALQASGATALIFRTSWVYGATGKNFLRTILKLARERGELRIVADQYGAPTWSRDLAHIAARVIAHCERIAAESSTTISEAAARHSGIYHSSGSGETTWAGFATEAIHQLQLREPDTKLATITPIPSTEYPTPAARPTNSRMSNEKLFQTFGYRMMDWRESLTEVLAELA